MRTRDRPYQHGKIIANKSVSVDWVRWLAKQLKQQNLYKMKSYNNVFFEIVSFSNLYYAAMAQLQRNGKSKQAIRWKENFPQRLVLGSLCLLIFFCFLFASINSFYKLISITYSSLMPMISVWNVGDNYPSSEGILLF